MSEGGSGAIIVGVPGWPRSTTGWSSRRRRAAVLLTHSHRVNVRWVTPLGVETASTS